MEFEWGANKARTNTQDHGVTFDEATTVFGSPFAVTYMDPDHSVDELRFLTYAYSNTGRALVVAHTERGD